MKAKYILKEVMKYLQDNKDSKVLRHLITSIKKEDILIAPDKMDEVPETNRNKR